MEAIRSYDSYTIPNTGATKNYTLADNVIHYLPYSSVTLAADMNFSTSDTPKGGTILTFIYGGGVVSDVAGGKAVNFFGTDLTDAQALAKATVYCFYNGSAWIVLVHPDLSSAIANIDTDNLVDQAVTNAKIADATIDWTAKFTPMAARGSLVRGGAAGVWQEVSAKTSGYLVGGDGTDVRSLAVAGDVTFAYSGGNLVTTIANSVITPEMLAFSIVGENLETNVTIATADVLTGNATPVLVIGPPGAGYGIEVISASISMTYVTAAYATNTVAQLITDTATVPQRVCNDILLSTVTRTLHMDEDFTIGATDTQIIANKGLYFKVKTGNPTAGDSDIKVKVRYRIIPM